MVYRHTLLIRVHSEFEFQVVHSNQSTTFEHCTKVAICQFSVRWIYYCHSKVVNPPESKLAKCTLVHRTDQMWISTFFIPFVKTILRAIKNNNFLIFKVRNLRNQNLKFGKQQHTLMHDNFCLI